MTLSMYQGGRHPPGRQEAHGHSQEGQLRSGGRNFQRQRAALRPPVELNEAEGTAWALFCSRHCWKSRAPTALCASHRCSRRPGAGPGDPAMPQRWPQPWEGPDQDVCSVPRPGQGASGTRPGCHPSGVGLPRGAQEGEQCGQNCILESSPGQCVGETTGISPGKGHGVDAQGLMCVVGTQSEEGRLQCTWWARSQSPVTRGRWTHRWILFSPSRALKIRKAGALGVSCRRGLLPEGPHGAGVSAAPRRRGEERGGWQHPIPSSVYTSTQCRGLSSRTTHRSARPGGPLPVTGGKAHSHQLAYGIARACPLQWLHVPPGAQPQGFPQEEWDTALWQTGRVDAASPWGGSQKRGPLSLALKNE